jgi:uncharacterized membrane protein HdeD (DUF308 family)
MLEILSRYWWAVALRAVAAVVFGIVAVIWPDVTLGVLVLLFGAYALVDGVIALTTALFGGRLGGRRRGWLVLEGVLGIVVGLSTFAWPDITTVALLWLIAAWAIGTGVLELGTAVALRRELTNEWRLVLSGVLSVAFGLFLAVRPQQGALALVGVVGLYAIVFGIALVALARRLRHHHHHRRLATPTPDQSRPAPA